jgi:multisubunit Na+/H+ antiporter MnhG subunit
MAATEASVLGTGFVGFGRFIICVPSMAALTPEKLIAQTMILLLAALLAPVLVASVTMNKRDYAIH